MSLLPCPRGKPSLLHDVTPLNLIWLSNIMISRCCGRNMYLIISCSHIAVYSHVGIGIMKCQQLLYCSATDTIGFVCSAGTGDVGVGKRNITYRSSILIGRQSSASSRFSCQHHQAPMASKKVSSALLTSLNLVRAGMNGLDPF